MRPKTSKLALFFQKKHKIEFTNVFAALTFAVSLLLACVASARDATVPVPLTVQIPTPSYSLEELQRGAQRGDPGALSNLGVRYQLGDGVPQNYIEAMRLYRAASDKGNKAAPTIIGLMYADGLGVKQDYKEAMRWYQLGHQRRCADCAQGFSELRGQQTRWESLYRAVHPNQQTNALMHSISFIHGILQERIEFAGSFT